jgi:hypothetical protein
MIFHTTLDILGSLMTGLLLSGTVYALGVIMDSTIGKESVKILKETKGKEYVEGKNYVSKNLLIISPIVYSLVHVTLLSQDEGFHFGKYLCLIGIQNVGYFFAHREMHRNTKLYNIHRFHHNFDEVVIPSFGNAVSHDEFLIAYVTPMIFGAFVLTPSDLTFITSIGTISLFNLIIHTQELYEIPWIPGLVSPTHHINHHKVRNKHYAAPLLNVDDFVIVTNSMWKETKDVQ